MWKTHSSAPAGADSITPGSSASASPRRMSTGPCSRATVSAASSRSCRARWSGHTHARSQRTSAGIAQVDGGEVDAGAPGHVRRVERRRAAAAQLAGDPQRRVGIPRDRSCVVVGVVVPQPVQPRARADLDLRERPPAGDRRERRQQPGAAGGLVGLRAAHGERAGELRLASGAEAGERGGQRVVGRARAADRRVVGGELVVGVAQQLVVDRGQEDHRRRLRRADRHAQQLRGVRDELADARVERRVGAHRLGPEAAELPRQQGGIHDVAR